MIVGDPRGKLREASAASPHVIRFPTTWTLTITRKSNYRLADLPHGRDVPRYPNGQYQLRVRLLRVVDGTATEITDFHPDAHLLNITLDNTPPTSTIHALYEGTLTGDHLELLPVPACGL